MRNRSILTTIIAVLTLTLGSSLAVAGQRVALSIGVSAYLSSPLPSPVKDATEVAKALASFGFDVTLVADPNSRAFITAVEAFIEKARGAEAAVVYFSGHGLQVNGEVYMLATDGGADYANLLQRDEFSVNGIVERLQRAGVDFKFVIVDACRNNPFVSENGRAALSTANAGRAERRIPATNALVSFASASGQSAQDWGSNTAVGLSLYTAALLDVIQRNAAIEVRELTQQARVIVQDLSTRQGGDAQNPSESSSMVRPVRLERAEGGQIAAFDVTNPGNQRLALGDRDQAVRSGNRQPSPPLAPTAPSRSTRPAESSTGNEGPTAGESLPADAEPRRPQSAGQTRQAQDLATQGQISGSRRGQIQRLDDEDGIVLSAEEG